LEIPIDSRAQIGSASSHVRWPFVGGMKSWVAPLFNHNGRPFSITKHRHRLSFCHIRDLISSAFGEPLLPYARAGLARITSPAATGSDSLSTRQPVTPRSFPSPSSSTGKQRLQRAKIDEHRSGSGCSTLVGRAEIENGSGRAANHHRAALRRRAEAPRADDAGDCKPVSG
jgi:hypothetical protein